MQKGLWGAGCMEVNRLISHLDLTPPGLFLPFLLLLLFFSPRRSQHFGIPHFFKSSRYFCNRVDCSTIFSLWSSSYFSPTSIPISHSKPTMLLRISRNMEDT